MAKYLLDFYSWPVAEAFEYASTGIFTLLFSAADGS